MKRGLALYLVLLMLAASWMPPANAQGGADHGFTPEQGQELSAFGRGYLENLVLRSGAGIDLVWGPSYDGNASALSDRTAELEAVAGGQMPPMVTPILVPFKSPDPGFSDPAPLNHSQTWRWNTTDVDAAVNVSDLARTIIAETELARSLLEAGDANDTAEAYLLLEAAVEAARFTTTRLGHNGTALVPLDPSEPNMTDANASNGYWLPVTEATGVVNASNNGSWEDVSVVSPPSLDTSLEMLRAVSRLGNLFVNNNTELVGAGKAFPEGTDTDLVNISSVLFNNVRAIYHDPTGDMFYEDHVARLSTLATLHYTMSDFGSLSQYFPYWSGWAHRWSRRAVDLILHLQKGDGTFMEGFDSRVGGAPESFLPDYMAIPRAADAPAHAMATRTLLDASTELERPSVALSARAALAAMDATYWSAGHHLMVEDPEETSPDVDLGFQVLAMGAFASAVDSVELAKYRVPQLWLGMVAAGLQMSETDSTGENYTAGGNDTDGDGIPRHNVSRGPGREHGVAPVLARMTSYDNATGNWTLEGGGMVGAGILMEAATLFMELDEGWFATAGEPAYSEEHSSMLLHWSDAELVAWMEARMAEIAALHQQVSALQDALDNASMNVSDLKEEISFLEENITALQLDLNESRENETILQNQTRWLRQKLEETNGTVDNLTKDIEVLESKVGRLEEDIVERDENVTKLEDQLRKARFNATELGWEVDNASAALHQAEVDLEAAEREREDAEDRLEEAEGRNLLVGVIALLAGIVIVLVILKLLGKV